MIELLETATVRILTSDFATIGAGFIVSSDGLVVTCAHVADAGKKNGEINVEFYKTKIRKTAKILSNYWSTENDFAFLKIEVDKVLDFLQLCNSEDSFQHDFVSLGFPLLADRDVHYAQGKISGIIPLKSDRQSLLELQGDEFEPGMSGSAVFDLKLGKVAGMMTEYIDTPKRRFAYAVTSETLIQSCPLLTGDYLLKFSIDVNKIYENIIQVRTNSHITPDSIERTRNIITMFSSLSKRISDYLRLHPDHQQKITIENILNRVAKDFQSYDGLVLSLNLKFPLGNFPQRSQEEINQHLDQLANAVNSLSHLLS